jgi:hypothetical protein
VCFDDVMQMTIEHVVPVIPHARHGTAARPINHLI